MSLVISPTLTLFTGDIIGLIDGHTGTFMLPLIRFAFFDYFFKVYNVFIYFQETI